MDSSTGLVFLIGACCNGTWQDVLNLLSQGADVHWTDTNGCGPLHWACFGDNLDVIRHLLRGYVDVNAAAHTGQTALHLAANQAHVRLVAFLLSRGADVRAADKKAFTALHEALYMYKSYPQRDYPAVIRTLLEHGAPVNQMHGFGIAPVHQAIELYFQDADILHLLVQRGADVNMMDHHGNTPLHDAVAFQNDNLIRDLLNYGASVNTPDTQGLSAVCLAAQHSREGHERILLMLVRWGLEAHTGFHEDYTENYCYVLSVLFESRFVVDWASKYFENVTEQDEGKKSVVANFFTEQFRRRLTTQGFFGLLLCAKLISAIAQGSLAMVTRLTGE